VESDSKTTVILNVDGCKANNVIKAVRDSLLMLGER